MKILGVALAGFLFTGTVSADTVPAAGTGPLKLDPVVVYGTVDAAGAIGNLSCGPKVAENICKVMTGAVAGWQFKPGTRAGQPAAMDINLNLGVVAVPQAKGYSLQVTGALLSSKQSDSASSGPGAPQFGPPVYPPDEARRGLGGIVDIEILLQPPSEKPQIGRLWFNGAESDRRQVFVKAATNAVQRWKLPTLPPEQLTLCVPIEFTSDSGPSNPTDRKSPCSPRYAEGFALPVLITKVGVTK